RSPMDLGSVVVRGGGALSALKPGAAGSMDDDSQWVPAGRLKDGAVTVEEVRASEFAVWTLPPGTKTRALRFTHAASEADKDYAGWIGGAYLLAGRFADPAAQALATASANEHHASKIVNGKHDDWSPWDNVSESSAVVSPEHPEWVLLSWPAEIPLRGLCALQAGFSQGEVQV